MAELSGLDPAVLLLRLDQEGRVVSANAAACAAYGYPPGELKGIAFDQLRSAVAGGSGPELHRRRDGTSFPVRGRLSALDGDALIWVGELAPEASLPGLIGFAMDQAVRAEWGQAGLEAALLRILERVVMDNGFAHAWVELAYPCGPVRVAYQATEPRGAKPAGREAVAQLHHHQQPFGLFGAGPCPAPALLQQLTDAINLPVWLLRERCRLHLYQHAFESAANAMVVTDREGRILLVNPAWSRLTGYEVDEVEGQSLRMLKSGLQPPDFYRSMWTTISAGRVWEGEMYNRRKDGSLYWDEQTISPIRGPDGAITHYVAVKKDGTQRTVEQQQLRHMVMHDPLTNLPNRSALRNTLDRVAQGAYNGPAGALLLIDLDHLHLVNDALGHMAADEVLVGASIRLRRALRPSDLLVRLGGGEFVAVLEEVNPSQSWDVAERLRLVLSEALFEYKGQGFGLTASIGVVPLDGRHNADEAMDLAYSALATAKEQGRNRVVYRHGQRVDAEDPGAWAVRLRTSLQEDHFVCHYQPVVRLQDGRVDFHEVLLRLRGEDGRLIPPSSFLPAAEQTGMMPAIDRWVITHVIRELQHREGNCFLVNLSGQSLDDPTFLTFLESLLTENPEAARRVALEVTESTGVKDVATLRRWMSRLQALGCRFALDDFGVGFSSFSYLRALPVDIVKLDGSFIRHLDTDATSRSLVQAITAVAHTLGKLVIAEWVESESVALLLRDMGVEYGQGYHWGSPGPNLAS